MKLIIGLSVLSFVLFFTTALLVWYMRKILTKLLYVSESMGDFLITVDSYAEHLDSVYNLEMFYGDETLEHLMKHTESVIGEIEKFSDIYSLTTELTEDEEAEQEEDFENYDSDQEGAGGEDRYETKTTA
tara:strand:+ start:483 stop:872 length:390 start_codon:yes stop_codon:yes gene_type:complete